MYRCCICKACSKPSEPLQRHVIQRTLTLKLFNGMTSARHEIERELPVCTECKWSLEHGISLRSLLQRHAPRMSFPVKPTSTPSGTVIIPPMFKPLFTNQRS